MFSLFKKKKVTIRSITVPDPGWSKVKENDSIIQWVNPQQTIAVSVNFFNIAPDIPTVRALQELRSFYREMLVNINGGLIEVELHKKKRFTIVRTIFKVPQEPKGITYVGSLTIPFKSCSFVLKVQAVEAGPTGLRETVVADKLMRAGWFDEPKWSADPYDSALTTGHMMNMAEAQEYDKDFPNHPLSQVRNLLTQLEAGWQWQSEVEKLASFKR